MSGFLSSLIPCPGICVPNQLFTINNLHERWRLISHPLYTAALRKMSLAETAKAVPSQDAPFHPNLVQSELDRSAYESIVFPSKRDLRYSKLNQQFKRSEGKIINNEHFYKLMIMNLNA